MEKGHLGVRCVCVPVDDCRLVSEGGGIPVHTIGGETPLELGSVGRHTRGAAVRERGVHCGVTKVRRGRAVALLRRLKREKWRGSVRCLGGFERWARKEHIMLVFPKLIATLKA